MGYGYKRGTKLWLGYHDAEGRLQQVASGIEAGDEKALTPRIASNSMSR